MDINPVWIVDDDKSIRWVLEKTLTREGVAFESFADAGAVLARLDTGALPSVLLSDIRMPGVSGIELLAEVKRRLPALPVIVMTAYSDLDSAVAAFAGGAFEYLPKPFDVDQALDLIRRAIGIAQETERMEGVGGGGTGAGSDETGAEALAQEIVGQSAAMQDVFRAIGRLAQSSATVLITGESGTGKERVAQALHRHGARRDKPFVAINTAAIPKDLLESELFGHERGAFTGAQVRRQGRFEQAEGGTLFLDEIGDMPTELQTRLLRVLSEGHFYRVGGHSPVKAKVRVIAATHQDLEARVKDGRFREDLLHRLNVFRIRLPSLRERSDDIPLLARYFLNRSARTHETEAKHLAPAALEYLMQLPFPGNVRQLENLCHWLTVMVPGREIAVSDLPPELREMWREVEDAAGAVPAPGIPGADWEQLLSAETDRLLAEGGGNVFDHLMRRFERVLIMRALAHSNGRRIQAAQSLGIGRNTITRKIQELGLENRAEAE